MGFILLLNQNDNKTDFVLSDFFLYIFLPCSALPNKYCSLILFNFI